MTRRFGCSPRSWSAFLSLVALVTTLFLAAAPAQAQTPPPTPAEQCAEGVKLAEAGKQAEALPLLQAGYDGRNQGEFADPGNLINCALWLGITLNGAGEWLQALEPLGVTLELARKAENREVEYAALYGVAIAYGKIWRYDEALLTYQQMRDLARLVSKRDWEGRALLGMGVSSRFLGEPDTALAHLQEALVTFQQLGDPLQTGSALLEIGNIYAEQRRDEEALQVYKEARELFVQTQTPQGEARVLREIADLYTRQGKLSDALDMLKLTLERLQEAGDAEGQVLTLSSIAQAYQEQGRHEQALEVLQQAEELTSSISPHVQSSSMGSLLPLRVMSLRKLGRYEEALAVAQEWRELARTISEREFEITALIGIGVSYDLLGRNQDALDTYEEARQLARMSGDTYYEGLATEATGTIFLEQGRYDEARQRFAEAQELLKGTSAEVANVYNIANAWSKQGRHDEARPFFEEALALAEGFGEPQLIDLVLSGFAPTLSALGEHERALGYIEQSLALAREGADPLAIAVNLNMLGNVLSELERHDEAFASYNEALALAAASDNKGQELTTQRNLGLTYLEVGKDAEALAAFTKAVDILDELRPTAGSEEGRIGFVARYADIYEEAARLALQQGQPEEAFAIVERGRARAFLDSLASGDVQLADTEANSLFQRERELYLARESAQEALAQARISTPNDARLLAELEAQLDATEAQYAEVIAGANQQHTTLAELRPEGATIPTLDQLQAALPQGATLVAYQTGLETTLAFVLARTSFTAHELPVTREALRQQITALVQNDDDSDADNSVPPAAVALHQQLIAPLDLPATTRQLLVVPHDLLHYLPFAALAQDRPWWDRQPRFLGERVALTVLPAAAVLTLPQNQRTGPPPAPLTPLVLGNPDGSLAHADAEARAVADLLGGAPLIGAEASEAALRAGASEASILHLATHGQFNPYAPLASTLTLAPVAGTAAEAGTATRDGAAGCGPDGAGCLDVAEVYGLDLRQAELVVLSACETSLNALSVSGPLGVRAGDEVVGLTRAFFFAGAPTVVATMWKVDDEASTLLMEHFYRELRNGVAPAVALGEAQRAVREHQEEGNRPYAAPYYWAGFVLYGEGSAPLWAPAPAPWWQANAHWLIGGGALLIVLVTAAIWWARRRRRLKVEDTASVPGSGA